MVQALIMRTLSHPCTHTPKRNARSQLPPLGHLPVCRHARKETQHAHLPLPAQTTHTGVRTGMVRRAVPRSRRTEKTICEKALNTYQ